MKFRITHLSQGQAGIDNGQDLSSSPNSGRHILVIGSGVSGLTTAHCLLEAGFRVTVVSDKEPDQTVSVIAGALWEWPPAVCGHHSDEISLKRSKAWAARSYEVFTSLAAYPETAVTLAPAVFYFRRSIDACPLEKSKMEETQQHVTGFERSPDLIQRFGVNPHIGLRDAYTYSAPRIATDAYLRWLRNLVGEAGCRFEIRRIEKPLDQAAESLCVEFQADYIVNCSGLGSIELAQDAMQPLRGALVRVDNDGTAMPRIEVAHCLANEDHNPLQQMIYIIPRGEKHLLLGGIAELGKWETNLGLDNYQPIREMLERCQEFLPILKSARLNVESPVTVGLRPYRPQNVRLESSADGRVIHNYGHGGSGFTFSWGCALDVVDLIQQRATTAAPHSSVKVSAG